VRLLSAGHTIIVGRGGNLVSRRLPGGIHIRLTAPLEVRVKRMAELLDADADEWITKAGRMPEDLKEIILSDLEQMPALLRAAKGLTPEQLRQFIEEMQRGKCEGDERS